MPESPVALMQQLHDDHAAALWAFCIADASSRRRREVAERVPERVPDGQCGWVTDAADRTDELLLSWIVAEAVTKLSAEHRAVLLECYHRSASVAEAWLGEPRHLVDVWSGLGRDCE